MESHRKNELAHQIMEIIPLVMRTVAAKMRQAEQMLAPVHFNLLWILEHRSFSLSELAEHQSVSLPTMSNSVTILEERGWARRRRSKKDRRRVLIEITPEGQAVLDEVRFHMEERVAEVIEKLSQSDKEEISHGLLLLRQAFATAVTSGAYGAEEHDASCEVE